jgi:hypothetical protein
MRALGVCIAVLLGVALALGAAPATQPQAALAVGAALATQPQSFADNACVQCHRDQAGRSAEIVELEWKQSVHYKANIGCDGCHGGNPALRREQFANDEAFKRASHLERSSDFLTMQQGQEFVTAARGRSISYFCGKCHADIKEQHLGSPHGEFGDPSCLYCHGQGSHQITHPTPAIIDTRGRAEGGRCSPCHRAGTMQTVSRIGKILIDAEEQIQTSGRQYEQLETWGYRNLELETLHHHAKGVQSRLRQMFHSFNLRDISNYAAEIQGVVDRTTATFELVQRLRQVQRHQTAVGITAVVFLLSLARLLVYYRRTFLK